MKDNELSGRVIGAAIEVHRALGPGLLESTYEECLCRELSLQEIPFERQVPLGVEYKGVTLDCGYRLDLLVEKRVIVELKAVETVTKLHRAQLLTYLKTSRFLAWIVDQFRFNCSQRWNRQNRKRRSEVI